jgi:hypothetical protein
MSWDQDKQDYLEQTTCPAPTQVEAQALVARARRRASPRSVAPLWGMLAVAAAAALFVLWPVQQPEPQVRPLAQVPPQAPQVVDAPSEVPALVVLSEGLHPMGSDEVQVGERSRVAVLSGPDEPDTRLEIEQGSAHFQVGKRADGASFTVVAAEHQVRVIGTRFEVVREPFSVEVRSGIVEVIRGAQRWTLKRGDRFAEGRVHSAAEPELSSLDDLRALVLGGALEQARLGLSARIAQDAADVPAQILMAQLQAKRGDRAEAVKHWEQVIRRGKDGQAHRAHYEAAVLLLDKPAAAEPHLRAFLATPGPLAADARLRLGRVLLAQGKRTEGAQELERLILAHPGSTPARVARELLK